MGPDYFFVYFFKNTYKRSRKMLIFEIYQLKYIEEWVHSYSNNSIFLKKTNEKHGRSPFFFITESLLNYKNSTLKFIQIIHIIQERLNVELAFKDFERTLKLTYTAALSNEISFKLESLKREFVSFSSFAFKKKKNFIKEIFKLRQYYINKLTKYIFSILSKAIFDSSFIFTFKKIFFLLRMIN